MPHQFLPLQRQPFARRTTRALLLGLSALSLPAVAIAQDAGTAPVQLDTVVITAGGFEQTVEAAPASVTVISGEELAKGNVTSLSDALKSVQGVATTGIANEEDITIRGLPGQYTLILVDGKRQGTRDRAPTALRASSKATCRRFPPSSASKSCAARCPRFTARMRWAASSTSSPSRFPTNGPAR
ncbi:TonB-dependent receptor plug domain-containing protein [Paracoccus cavernae]|uniref:TonB-dependent receptor plug domain-containing protein n=1 Tax=Paracoccus cavernae TaxID=1571207 RepID=A0ABT8D9P8_9RHOB|nr:TonB-dependent receptor plug domain-containing protein [Paracoccus cavernae]